MGTKSAILFQKNWTASELRKLPAKQRNMLLKTAAAIADEDYRIDPELMAFEAFGEGDLYGHSSNAQTKKGRNLAY